MITSSHVAHAAPATAERSLSALEATVSQMAADSPVAAERLHEAGAATSPALGTRPSTAERTHGSEHSIVVGYDGSDAARRALARAAEAAGEHGTVVVVTTEPQLFSSGPAAEPLLEPGDDPSRLGADARRVVTEHGTVGNVVVVTRKGDPAEELLNVACSVAARRIVIGQRGKNFVARALMGSVATRVVEHAPCDVLVVA